MPINVEALLKRYERMTDAHQLWRPIWQEIREFILPNRSDFTFSTTPGQKKTRKLYDSTALRANQRLAATLNTYMTGDAYPWFSLKVRGSDLDEDYEVQVWLEECTQRMYRAFNQSNFSAEIQECYLDLIALGTSAMFVEEREPQRRAFDGFVFRHLDLSNFGVEEDYEGYVNTVFRTFPMTAGMAVSQWGQDCGEKVLKAFNDGKQDQEFEFLHAIFPSDPVVSKIGRPKTNLPFASAYISCSDKHLIVEGGYHEFPTMVPRWSKAAGEKYGRGIGHYALPDVASLNKAKELSLKTWAKTLDMPTKSREEGIVGPIRTTPSANTVVRNMDDLAPLYPPGYFRESLGNEQLKGEELRTAIEECFFANLTELPDGPVMTAYEVAKRLELLHRKLGAELGRIKSELLRPMIDRGFGIMYRHGALPPPPAVLLEAGAEIDIEYQGPLAKAQRLAEAEGIESVAAQAIQVAQVYPDALDIVDWEEGMRINAEIRGAPTKVLRSPEAVQAIRDARARQQAEQQQKADLVALAEGAGKAAPMVKALQPTGGQ